jgi:hypothetical protein
VARRWTRQGDTLPRRRVPRPGRHPEHQPASGSPRGTGAAIREALAGRLAEDLDRSGLSPAVLLDFARLRGERFAEYEEAAGLSISLQALGTLAWRRIADTDDPSDRMTMFLALRATAELQAVRGVGKRYLLITPPRSFFSAPDEE